MPSENRIGNRVFRRHVVVGVMSGLGKVFGSIESMKLNFAEYEKTVLAEIIANNPEWEDYLKTQLENASVEYRHHTGCGCYVDFIVDEEKTNPIDFGEVPVLLEADAVAPDKSDAVFFMLYTKESESGKSRILHFLEIAIVGTYYDEKEIYSWLFPEDGSKHDMDI